MKKVIVTGANGFIGSSLIKKLVEQGVAVVAVDLSFAVSRLPENSLITKIESGVDVSLAEIIPAGEYAAFTSARGGFAGDEIPKLWSLIFDSWLPDSGYRLRSGDVIEVLHLWNNKAQRKMNRYYEIWVPVIEK